MARTLRGQNVCRRAFPIIVIIAEWPHSADDGVSRACGAIARDLVRAFPKRFPRGPAVQLLSLEGGLAKREGVVRALERFLDEKGAVIFYGHGCNTGKALMEAILDEAEARRPARRSAIDFENCALLRGKIVYAVACHSARGLGPRAIEESATSYIGYSGRLALMVNKELVPGIETCVNAGLVELVENRGSCDEAVLAIYRAYRGLSKSLRKQGVKKNLPWLLAVYNCEDALVSRALGCSDARLW